MKVVKKILAGLIIAACYVLFVMFVAGVISALLDDRFWGVFWFLNAFVVVVVLFITAFTWAADQF